MSYSVGDLRQVLAELAVRRGDSTTHEVKRARGGLPTSLGSTICAFANMPGGGVLILGVDERDGFAVTGVGEPAKIEAGIVDVARNAVSPSPHVTTQTLTVDGRHVVVAEVSPLRAVDKPAVFGGRAYLRQADGDYVMHEHELRMVEVDKLHAAEVVDYDMAVVPGLTVDDLVPELVAAYVARVRDVDRRMHPRSDAEILRWTGVVTATGAPTLAGVYAMGDYPQGMFPALAVTAAVQVPRETGDRNRDLRDFTGPIPALLDDLMDWVSQNVPTARRYREDGHMVEEPVLPLRAARELLANALVHRDLGPNTLGTGKSIQVRLTPSVLMIQSPGGLRGVSLEQLLSDDHAQAAVNQRLYSMCKKLTTDDGASVIEGEGGGIREVFTAARALSLPRPQLVNTGVQFTALLYLPVTGQEAVVPIRPAEDVVAQPHRGDDSSASSTPTRGEQQAAPSNEDTILTLFAPGGEVAFRAMVAGSGLTDGQVRYALNKLLAAGRLERLGGQGLRSTTYRRVSVPAES